MGVNFTDWQRDFYTKMATELKVVFDSGASRPDNLGSSKKVLWTQFSIGNTAEEAVNVLLSLVS